MISKQQGIIAENFACKYLENAGLKLISRNFRCKLGEIDLIMQENNTLVFVEVRYRKNNHFGSPIESINYSKCQRLRQTADLYLQKYDKEQQYDWRFDWIGLSPSKQTNSYHVEWLTNAYEIDH